MEKSFVYGVAVSDYNFTGREEETRRLKHNFENGINSILISPRRWGKTSLVDHVCRQLEGSDIITVRLDIFGCKSEYDFYNVLAAAVLKQTATKVHSGYNEKKVRTQFDLGSPSNMVRLRNALIERDIIYSEMRQLYITDPVFTLWFRQRFL